MGSNLGYSGFCREKVRGMRNAYYARDNFDVRRGGRGFSCAVKNTLISQKDAVDTRTFRVKPNTPKLLSMPGKNGSQLWDLPSISIWATCTLLFEKHGLIIALSVKKTKTKMDRASQVIFSTIVEFRKTSSSSVLQEARVPLHSHRHTWCIATSHA